ncbi:MAG: ABC transporter substrate-binding protein [Bacteroidota bacterium]
MMRKLRLPFTCFFLILILACQNKENQSSINSESTEVKVDYAKNFSINTNENYTLVEVNQPWPEAKDKLRYVVAEDKNQLPKDLVYTHFIQLPVERLVVTSTTHIPALAALDLLDSWVGFPGLDYVSTPEAREKIAANQVSEIGENEKLNTELLIDLNPDLVVSFAVEGNNKSLESVKKAGIPVTYNSDWLEENPLGKAEWIKFFGALTGKLDQAEAAFSNVEKTYLETKKKASQVENKPTVLSGAMHKDQWFLPKGNSWQAQFIEDANANYLFQHLEGTGSASLTFEVVLDQAQEADFWVAPAQYTKYSQLLDAHNHYAEFSSFQQEKIFTVADIVGETGGVLYYETGPNRPDLILKDMVKIFHPELMEDYEFTFFKPLQ